MNLYACKMYLCRWRFCRKIRPIQPTGSPRTPVSTSSIQNDIQSRWRHLRASSTRHLVASCHHSQKLIASKRTHFTFQANRFEQAKRGIELTLNIVKHVYFISTRPIKDFHFTSAWRHDRLESLLWRQSSDVVCSDVTKSYCRPFRSVKI